MRKRSARHVWLLVGLAVLQLSLAARPSAQPVRRIDRLDEWLTGIDRHQPGTFDGPAQTIRRWNADALRWLWIDLNSVITLMRNPGARLFFMPTPGRNRPTQYVYSGSDLRRLIALASREAPQRIESRNDVEHQSRVRTSVNRLLKRGAMLHADIALFAELESPPADGPVPSGAIRIQFSDGRRIGADDVPVHWQTGRTLLGSVSEAASRDEMVRLWYQATIAQMQGALQINPGHISQALQLFPSDADLLFFNACHHEVMATAEMQAVARTLPREMNLTIESERSELREAETYFRRALEQAPDSAEARLRLGHVLGRQGRHAEAAEQLRLVAPPAEPLLAYYHAMFLAAEMDALGRPSEARDSYERAAALYPRAQSPLLALSQIAQRAGDLPGAARALEQAFRLPSDDLNVGDPWWTYHVAQGRDAGARLRALYDAVPPAEAR